MSAAQRSIEEILVARSASDGAGVRLKRVFGGRDLARFDPFLMLDEFGSEAAADYIGGFPEHPHRGFETVTYMLEGAMEHRDHMGNVGRLGPGDVQWMKAGSGVIHSEMPQQEEGRMRGFQLWVNLPAAEKMSPAEYRDIAAESIPSYLVGEVTVKAIAGELKLDEEAISGSVRGLSTDPVVLDLRFGDSQTLDVHLPRNNNVLIYVYEGAARVAGTDYAIQKGNMARLTRNDDLTLSAEAGSELLLISGRPLGEPIVHHGPFVMNSTEEIQQAIHDYSNGVLVNR